MNENAKNICDMILDLTRCSDAGDGVFVRTSCVFPSGALVIVHISVRDGYAVVSDQGVAAREAYACGINVDEHAFRNLMKIYSVKFSNDEIYLDNVDFPLVQTAIRSVANFAKAYIDCGLYARMVSNQPACLAASDKNDGTEKIRKIVRRFSANGRHYSVKKIDDKCILEGVFDDDWKILIINNREIKLEKYGRDSVLCVNLPYRDFVSELLERGPKFI
ncbi:MAG TPA: hypothetical protein VK196_09355 [Magnetospirillum sp.]|nr:hypothetical protein [Magnetospirillum sp.]